MVQKYQNEISPTIYYGISTKTNEKDLKIPNLQLPDWKHPYWMTLYITVTLTDIIATQTEMTVILTDFTKKTDWHIHITEYV